MALLRFFAIAILLLSGSLAFGNDSKQNIVITDELKPVIVQLMQDTKVIMREGLNGPVSDYKSDGDPGTLEIVMLQNKSDGPSHVSDDGEVIFMQAKARGKEQEQLIQLAFYLKAQRKLESTQQSSASSQ